MEYLLGADPASMSLRRTPQLFLAIIVLTCAFAGGCQQVRQLGGFPERLVDAVTGQTPRNAVVKMEDTTSPDHRREGINELVDRSWGKAPPYTTRYEQIAQYDPDYLVRATAIRALNRSRDQQARPLYIKALNDPSEMV